LSPSDRANIYLVVVLTVAIHGNSPGHIGTVGKIVVAIIQIPL
jgi:hypothetical protein